MEPKTVDRRAVNSNLKGETMIADYGRRYAVLAFAAVFIAVGCSQQNGGTEQSKQSGKNENKSTKKEDEIVHNYAGWWCVGHGIPEHECSLCLGDDEVNEKFKSKGDWCDLHDRAKSQCFKCDPSLYKAFEARFLAKFGKAPPRPPESEFQK